NPRTEGQGPVSIYTPSAVVNVQGTTLAVGVGLSGAARVAVEAGKVDLVPVTKADGAAVEVPQGKVVVVPFGQPPAAPAAYQAANAGWDEWLETEDKQAADKAEAVADVHAGQVEALQKDAETLDQAAATADGEAEKLAADAAAAEKKADDKAYVVVQPKIATTLDTQVAARDHRMLVDSRLLAHAYLLALLRARIKGGVYKVPAPVLAKIETRYENSYKLSHQRRIRALQRYRAERAHMKRWQKHYYIHHPRGRAVAPKLKVVVPPFYMKAKIRPMVRPAPVRLVGYDRPVYRRPAYRGKFQPYRPVVVAARPGVRPPVVPVFRPKAWHNNDNWRKEHQARVVRMAPQRAVWKKAVIEKRQVRWAKRPDTRTFHRGPMGVRGPMHDAMGPHGPGPVGPGPMLRDPHGMGPVGPGPVGPGPMLREPHGMGPVGPGPMLRDPHGMGPHGPGPRGPGPMLREPRGMDGPGHRGPGPMLREPMGMGRER
ncbi:MAG: hypothetical protein RBU30_14755, partial [Polyangia bacterium]|nr:hypothetical protein [Polyangia bacterium]